MNDHPRPVWRCALDLYRSADSPGSLAHPPDAKVADHASPSLDVESRSIIGHLHDRRGMIGGEPNADLRGGTMFQRIRDRLSYQPEQMMLDQWRHAGGDSLASKPERDGRE
jgi:hypothetical protein